MFCCGCVLFSGFEFCVWRPGRSLAPRTAPETASMPDFRVFVLSWWFDVWFSFGVESLMFGFRLESRGFGVRGSRPRSGISGFGFEV